MKLPDFCAADASLRFHREVWVEHVEETAFLYEQRLTRADSSEGDWYSLAALEERIDNHLDALASGGEASRTLCAERAADGGAGELFAATAVFCRQIHASSLWDVLRRLDGDDLAKTRAVVDALKYELPVEWRDSSVRALAGGDRKLTPILAQVLAYRRVAVGDSLLNLVADAPPTVQPELLWSIGRTSSPGADGGVRPWLGAIDGAVAGAAVHAGLRLHDEDARRELVGSHEPDAATITGLGLAGGRGARDTLLEMLQVEERSRDTVVALGLLGDLGAVRALIDRLAVDTLAGAVADALHVITGADLFEDIAVPDSLSADEMFPDEAIAFRERGELPRRPDGEPYVTRVHRLSRDPAVWEDWLRSNAGGFLAGRRYRCGLQYSPAVLLDCLRSRSYPKFYRQWIGDELQIRYGIDLAFEADMFVAQQLRVIAKSSAGIAEATARFEAGLWYFAGRPVN
jgi:uncharacterized protein (TIGR02270 family)